MACEQLGSPSDGFSSKANHEDSFTPWGRCPVHWIPKPSHHKSGGFYPSPEQPVARRIENEIVHDVEGCVDHTVLRSATLPSSAVEQVCSHMTKVVTQTQTDFMEQLDSRLNAWLEEARDSLLFRSDGAAGQPRTRKAATRTPLPRAEPTPWVEPVPEAEPVKGHEHPSHLDSSSSLGGKVRVLPTSTEASTSRESSLERSLQQSSLTGMFHRYMTRLINRHGCTWWVNLTEPPRTGKLADVVQGRRFEMLTLLVISLNCLYTLYEANYHIAYLTDGRTNLMVLVRMPRQ